MFSAAVEYQCVMWPELQLKSFGGLASGYVGVDGELCVGSFSFKIKSYGRS